MTNLEALAAAIRFVPSRAMTTYRAVNAALRDLGPATFAAVFNQGLTDWDVAVESDGRLPSTCYHARRPGMIRMSAREEALLRRVLGEPASSSADTAPIQTFAVMARLGWLDERPSTFHDLARHAITTFHAIQNEYELASVLSTLAPRRPRIILEIGTGRGGTLFAWSQIAADDALLISVDLPGAPKYARLRAADRDVLASFARRSQRVEWVLGDSHADETVRRVGRRLQGRAVDLLFIDGDHGYEGVRDDYRRYAPLVGDGGVVALHDICVAKEHWPEARTQSGDRPDVERLWRELCASEHTSQIVDPNGACRPNRPAGVPCAWGIGLVQRRGEELGRTRERAA
jgi:predicted O-methyltransferase YrrM